MSMKVEIVGAEEFKKTLDEFAHVVRTDVRQIALQQAKLICRDAMVFTPPLPSGGGRGLTDKARKAGNNAVRACIKRIFVPSDVSEKSRPIMLKRIINVVKGNQIEEFKKIARKATTKQKESLSPIMQRILNDPLPGRAMSKAKNYLSKTSIFNSPLAVEIATDLRSVHDRIKGEVGGRWKKGAKYRGPKYWVETQAKLDAYIWERQTRVGGVKSGWAAAQAKIPKTLNGVQYGKFNAPWVTSNIRISQGAFNERNDHKETAMYVENLLGNINNVADEADVLSIVYGLRNRSMKEAIIARFDKIIAKANKRL